MPVQYQRMRIPACHPPTTKEWRFNYNFPEYFETCFRADAKPLTAKPQVLKLDNVTDYRDDKHRYARESILWGRKSGTMLIDVKWRDEEALEPVASHP